MSPETPVYLLDSFALLAYLGGEALYIIERRRGLNKAHLTLALVERLPPSARRRSS